MDTLTLLIIIIVVVLLLGGGGADPQRAVIATSFGTCSRTRRARGRRSA